MAASDKKIEMRDNGGNNKNIKMQNDYVVDTPPETIIRRKAMIIS